LKDDDEFGVVCVLFDIESLLVASDRHAPAFEELREALVGVRFGLLD